MPRPLAMLCLIAAMTMTGSNVPLAKLLVTAMPPEVLLVARFAIAAAVLGIAARAEPGPRLATLDARQWCAVGVLGIVGSVLFTWAVLEGVRRTSGASAGIILAALPAVVAVIGLVRGERLARGEGVMIALAVAGVALIQAQAPDAAPDAAAGAGGGGAVAAAPPLSPSPTEHLLGNLLIGAAVLFEAAFVVVARGISRHIAPLRLSLAVALVSLLVCLPTGLSGLAQFDPTALAPATWALLGWYALTASVLCTALWYRGVAHVETWAAGLATAAVPVAALAVSVAVLGERIAPAQVAGAVLVIGAIAVGTLSQRSGDGGGGGRGCGTRP